ncbi:MAG TPA: BlaI/MecI/CopY family transcriptional regulator [Pirellulales bacterium]
MTDRPALSKGEMEVARVLWELGSATVRQVHEAFPPGRAIEFAVVQTYLRRLEAKGYVHGRMEGRTRVYRPKVRAKTVIRDTIDDMLERLFAGETLPLVRHLIEDRPISDDDLAALRALLDRLEKKER